MKKFCSIFMMLLVASITLWADGYFKTVERTEAFYNFGNLSPASEQVVEYWFSKNQATMIRPRRQVTVDLVKKKMIIINRQGKTYVETSLPLNPDTYAEERLANGIKNFVVFGSAEKTTGTKKIGTWNCRAFKVDEWRERRGQRAGEKEITLWVTNDIKVDMDAFNRVFSSIRKYQGLGEKYREELKKTGGIEVYAQIIRHVRGSKAESNRKLLEFSQKDPPPGIYNAPKDFKKKEKLSIEDFRN